MVKKLNFFCNFGSFILNLLEKILMKKVVKVFLMSLLGFGVFGNVYAGPFILLCAAPCIATCEAACAAITAGLGAAACLIPCIEGCLAGCATVCFSPTTTIVVLENGHEVEKPITDIRAGDTVITLKDGKPMWTKVLKNTRETGFHEFIHIHMQNTTSQKEAHLDITSSHIVILRNEDGVLRVDTAKNVVVGDHMVASDGSVLSVVGVRSTYMQDRYTLATSEGTVIASNVLVSTICSDMAPGGEHLFQPTMEKWYKMHNSMVNVLNVKDQKVRSSS
jgi:hypothetical protein